MNNPFSKNHESTDRSAWADWLADDTSAQKKAPEPLDFSRGRSKHSSPKLSFPPKQSTEPRSAQVALDAAKFQEQRTQNFMSKQGQGILPNRQVTQLPSKPQPKPKSKPQGERKEIAVSINLPAVSLTALTQYRPSPTLVKRVFIGAALALVIGLMVFTPRIINSEDKVATQSAAGGTQNIPKAFAELKPEDSQNVTNERYDANRGYYAFNDRYKGGNVTVTEQQLPDNVRDNAEKGKELAQSVGATDDYETTQGMLYLTLSDTKTAQRAVLLHRQLLIFIQSTEPMAPTAWVDYVQSLQ